MDTIFALATAHGTAGLAVVRISGPDALEAAGRLAGPLPVTGRSLRLLRGRDGEVIDQARVLTFAPGHSFTGEAVAELHLHGSVAVVRAVLQELAGALRPAVAGEFTHRALDNGRLDLAQVEGLADLIAAETEQQRRQAMRVFGGALGAKADIWRSKLIRAAALIEATIDFADEDVPVDVVPEVAALLDGVVSDLDRESAGVRIAERIRDGFEVAIVGAPNVGKSTLLNYLAGREAAITSEHAGTTRDVIEVRLDLDGLAVTLLDTAGLREAGDAVEQVGIARGISRAESADVVIHLVLPGERPELAVRADDLLVTAKADLYDGTGLAVSGQTGAGVDRLIDALGVILRQKTASVGLAMRERHRAAMQNAVGHLRQARSGLPEAAMTPDLVAEDIRAGIRAIDSLVGRVDVEDILGEIFSSFCIGK